MNAIQITRTGGPEVLEYTELADPVPGTLDVLIHVEASGVNFIDTYFREGRYPAQLPYILGQEAAGTVISVGAEVTGLKSGDRVAWCGVPGTYATVAVAPASRVVKIPDGISTQHAAAVLLQGVTAHYLTHSTFNPSAGDKVLIHAGAGGTGHLLVQLAKRLGAYVITTVSTPAKAAQAKATGADDVILYTQEDFVERVLAITNGMGVPVVYDSVGKSTFEQSLRCLKPRGMLVLFGGASGAVPPFDLIRLSTMGSLYITRPTLKDYIATRDDLEFRAEEIFRWVADGSLTVSIGNKYTLRDAAQAHLDLESRGTSGKLLLLP